MRIPKRGTHSPKAGAPRRNLLAQGLVAGLAAAPLAVPAAAQPLVGDGSVTCGTAYEITSGDTLSQVAGRAYGDPLLYGVIADANWDALGGNPENVAVGMVLMIPCIDASGQILTPEEAAEVAASIEAAVAAEGPLSPAQLDALFGPVALFPDPVLTPVLVATTFPLDVVKAGRFVEGAADLSDDDRAAQAAGEDWDDSVRELAAAFPDLVTRMSDHIDWTEQAGEAVVAQTDDVLAAIQRLRTLAQENGYLVDNEAQTVEVVDEKITIAPASPNVVYVPTYDSQVVYTTPVAGPPAYYYDDGYNDWNNALITGGIILGGAVILDEIFDDDDWNGWDIDDDIDWDRGDITIDRGDVDIDRGDINIDRGDINIDRGDINIGGGDRVNIGDGDRTQIGDRVSIGDSDRPQIDRGDLADRAGDRAGAGERQGNRTSVSNSASRDAARQKIAARESTRVAPATLPPSIGSSRAASERRSDTRALSESRPSAGRQAPSVSRPNATRTPSARTPSHSSAFQQPKRSHSSAASNRGRSSAGRSGGGRSRGGGGRRR